MSERFEIEKKYRLRRKDRKTIAAKLKSMGFVYVDTRNLYDYFIPGTRPDERLRVRQEGNHQFSLTFKENIVIDSRKTKRESEPEIHGVAAHLIIEAASMILKEPVPSLYKVRQDYKGGREDFVVHVVIDYVPELKKLFSAYFMEVEILIGDAGRIKEAKKLVKEIAREIFGEKRKPSSKSYRRMLFETLEAKGKFPRRWHKLLGTLDPRDTGIYCPRSNR